MRTNENDEAPFERVISLLPIPLRQAADSLSRHEKILAEELRLRVGQRLSVSTPNGEYTVTGSPVIKEEDLHAVLEIASCASVHTVLDKMRNGFVTIPGGHRIGICGTAVMKDGAIYNIRQMTSLSIRIAREYRGIGVPIIRELALSNAIPSTLLLSPPGCGKTTLLRDMIFCISSGIGVAAKRVGVADDRGELSSLMDLGPRTDVMEGCPKADGLLMLLRGMAPQMLAADEITAPSDLEALEQAAGCGVTLLATAHGGDVNDLKVRPLYRRLMEQRLFRRLVTIRIVKGVRQYEVYSLEDTL